MPVYHLVDPASQASALPIHDLDHGLAPVSQPLFSWVPDARAPALHDALARQGIWTRLFDAAGGCAGSLRLGLPPDHDAAWQRLDAALTAALHPTF